ncbi:MAG: L-aspartate oxidase, partial [Bacillota bacterium]
MQRFVLDSNRAVDEVKDYDVVIVGGGVAGLYSAFNLEKKLKTLIINKSDFDNCNSMLAQGGIASICLSEDSFDLHYKDTLKAGAGLCDKEAVKILVQQGPYEIKTLEKMGVPFDKDSNDNFMVTREGAHSRNRIVHCGGDSTGYHLTKKLLEKVLQKDNIDIKNNTMLLDILTFNNETTGVLCQQNDKIIQINTSNVIMASGGIGRLYRNSTNSLTSTGDGIATCIRAGAKTKNMEFVQFHPTAFTHPDNNMRYFLISEAVRGEGAVLKNRKGQRFMKMYHPLGDLAPRDVVSRAVVDQMKKHDLPCVYLDITHKDRKFLKNRFPKIYQTCLKSDIDMAVTWIPVVPAQHYFMGGVKTDLWAKTNINGLYALGESACSGVHGANRLASNSLLECLVFGRRCAEDINNKEIIKKSSQAIKFEKKYDMQVDIMTYRSKIRDYMTKNGGIIRNQ